MLILGRGSLILISAQLFLSSGKGKGLQGNVMHPHKHVITSRTLQSSRGESVLGKIIDIDHFYFG